MIKRLLLPLTVVLASGNLQAQATGTAAVVTAETAKSSNWQSWTFAASAIVTAAGAVFLVSLHDGAPASTAH